MKTLKRTLPILILAVLVLGCGKKHPVKVYVDPKMEQGDIDKIAVFPFTSAVHHTDDPDGDASRKMDALFRDELDLRNDYQFVAPASVTYALDGEGLGEAAQDFVDEWRKHGRADAEFLAQLGQILRVEAVLIGVVDLWQKDEVDVQENATPTTYVGATVSILSVEDGSVLFQASDEDFVEGTRSEDRTVIRSGSGQIYSDPSSSVYRAPEHDEAALKVVKALVGSIPLR